MNDFDALLVLSFGGPDGPDDVMPFLENVTRGRNVPRERLEEVAEHYYHFGGRSPINEQNRALIAALVDELARHEIRLPVYWGNRNWHPLLPDALRQMREDKIRRALVFVTSAFGSYSGCRQYREDMARAIEEVGPGAPHLEKLRHYYNHPGFIDPMTERVGDALSQFPPEERGDVLLLFTAHSIPTAMAAAGPYERQLEEACRLIANRAGHERWRLVYQSRSGPPQVPWLEPDILDALQEVAAGGEAGRVVIAPVGFVSDHMEVLYDLDTEAVETCEELGLTMVRAGTVGVHPVFISMIRHLIEERLYDKERVALGPSGPWPDVCPPGCCQYTPRRPATAGT